MESSVDGKASRHFFSGNWFGASTTNKGINWSYRSPYADMPDFCCDQVVRMDVTRNIFLWLRMGRRDAAGENRFRLSVDFNDPFTGGYWVYDFKPENVNSAWQNVWWDYPAMSLTADYLFIAWNMFDNAPQPNFVRTVVLKFPLDALAAGAGFTGSVYATTGWFTIKPVDGADHTMYMASNWPTSTPQNSRIGIWRWKDSDNSLVLWTRTVPAWNLSGDCTNNPTICSHCGNPNWLARSDQRILGGARYNLDTNVANPGRNILAWWWNVREGIGFPHPYINGVAFYEDTMSLVSGSQGRPYLWSSVLCLAYPDASTNQREDLGMVFNYSVDPDLHKPYAGFMLQDDYQVALPGGPIYGAVASNAGPSDLVWGDYNTVRAFNHHTTWIAGVHYIPGSTNCSNCSVPLYFSFGRERDQNNYWWW
jgi:hypothetical protein